MSTLAQRRVILWRNFYQSLSLKIVKISTPRKKLVARSRIWNSMILTSLNIVLWPGHIESWPHGAFFISAIFGTVASVCYKSSMISKGGDWRGWLEGWRGDWKGWPLGMTWEGHQRGWMVGVTGWWGRADNLIFLTKILFGIDGMPWTERRTNNFYLLA